MGLIKDLSKVKDEEITLEDVKRAEEIIARANKLLGRKTVNEHHYWHGWSYWKDYVTVPFTPHLYTTTTNDPNKVYCGASMLSMNLTDAVAKIG